MTNPEPGGTGGAYVPGGSGAVSPYGGSAVFGWSDFDSALWGPETPVQYGRHQEAKPVIGPVPGQFIERDAAGNPIRPLDKNGKPVVGPLPERPTTGVNTPDVAAMPAILQRLTLMKPDELTRLQAKLKKAGYIGPNTHVQWGLPDDATKNAFAEVLMVTSRLTIAGTDKTWQEVLDESADPSDDVKKAMESAGISAKGNTSVNKDVYHLNYQQAKSAFESVFQDSIGRLPTADETRKFQSAFNVASDKNPTVTTTVTDAEGNSTTTHAGGVDAGQFTKDQVRENPDYANYQAVATYFPMLEQALGQVSDSHQIL